MRPAISAVLAAAALAACVPAPRAPVAITGLPGPDGFLHYAGTGPVRCDNRPIALDASHARIEVIGACGHVRVAGEHDDVIVQMVPNGTIDVTGGHNDVWWRPTVEGTRPQFHDAGDRNSFHRDDG